MAKLTVYGFGDLIDEMQKIRQFQPGQILRILYAGANVMREAWWRSLESLGLIETGTLINHIGYKQNKDAKYTIIVEPQGVHHYYTSRVSKRRRAQTNSAVAFELEYGNIRNRAFHHLENAVNECAEEIVEAEQAEFDAICEEIGL